MEPITTILDEPLRLVRWIRQSRGAAVDAASLRAACRSTLARARRSGEERGIAAADLDEVTFAIVALIDEAVAARADSLAQEWAREQLQLTMFGENTAGETFFERLETLRGDRSRAGVLAAYYLVLAVGFRGRYAVRGELALQELIETVRADLEGAGVLDERPLAPAAARPREPAARRAESWIVLALGAGALLLAAVLYAAVLADLGYRVHAIVG